MAAWRATLGKCPGKMKENASKAAKYGELGLGKFASGDADGNSGFGKPGGRPDACQKSPLLLQRGLRMYPVEGAYSVG